MEKLEIIVPTYVGDLNLGQYQRIIEAHEADETDLNLEVFEIVTGVPAKLSENIKGNIVLETYANVISMISKNSYPFINKFSMEDTEFGFIPDMEGSMTYAEYVDLDTHFKGGIPKLHNMMAVMFRPIVDHDVKRNKYILAEYTDTREYAEAMKLMPLDVALGGYNFFIELGKELLRTIPSYLKTQIASNNQHQLDHLEKDGDIMHHYTNLLEGISSTIKQLENSTITKHLAS